MSINKAVSAFLVSLLVLAIQSQAIGGQSSNRPALPTVFLDTTYVPPAGNTIMVPAGSNLQYVLDQAVPGDEIVLEAGATYFSPSEGFSLPPKSGSGWITIRSSDLASLPAEGQRVIPSLHAPAMAKIVSRGPWPALSAVTLSGSDAPHHYRLIGIEFTISPEVTINYGIVSLGGTQSPQTTLEQVPHDIIIDRCYIHGHENADVARGIALNSARTAVIDSHISECHGRGFDTQAICGWNGPGPFKIVNNHLEAAGENVMFGGADPKIPGLVPSDIEIRRNHFFKPLSWNPLDASYAGTHWAVKNLLELKNARRVLIEGNLFENNWADAQNGFAILFTPRNQGGRAPWSVVEDVVFRKNIVRRAAGGINILGRDYIHPSEQTRRIAIENNLFYELGGEAWGVNGRFLQINETAHVRVAHNTVFHTGNVITAYGEANTGFVFTNNLMNHNEYGIVGDNTTSGMDTLNRYFPGLKFKKNVIVGAHPSLYPRKKNYYPASCDEVGFVDWRNGQYRLRESSPYRRAAKKNRDIGADIDSIEVALGASNRSLR